MSFAADTGTSDWHHTPPSPPLPVCILNGLWRGLLGTRSVWERDSHPEAFLPPPPNTPRVWERQKTRRVAPHPFPRPQISGSSLLVLRTEGSRPLRARPGSSHLILNIINPAVMENTPFLGDESITKGRAVFRITLCLRSEFPSLGGPQKDTRNSLIPGHLPPSGGHFSTKREAPGSKRHGRDSCRKLI